MNKVDKRFMLMLSLSIIILLLGLFGFDRSSEDNVADDDILLTFGIIFVILFTFSWLIYSAWFNPESKAKELRKSAMKDIESNNLLSAKIKFQQLGDAEIVRELEAAISNQSNTLSSINDSVVSGNISYNINQNSGVVHSKSKTVSIVFITISLIVAIIRLIVLMLS